MKHYYNIFLNVIFSFIVKFINESIYGCNIYKEAINDRLIDLLNSHFYAKFLVNLLIHFRLHHNLQSL